MRTLVTGASGLLGSEIVRQLSQTGNKDVFAAYSEHPPTVGRPIHLNLTNASEITGVIGKIRPELIVHCAAVTNVDRCEDEPEIANLINGEATGKIGVAAEKIDSYVVYVSTDYVFDGHDGLYRELDIPRPVNHYGESKLLGERMLQESGVTCCIARTSVLYGWGGERRENFATWVLNTLQSGKPLKAPKGFFASPTLNHNMASMLLETASRRLKGIIHLAGCTRIDRYHFSLQLAAAFGLDPAAIELAEANSIGWRARRPVDSSLSVEKAMRLLDRKPLKLHEALEIFKAGWKR